MSETPVLYLDGESLTPELLMDLSQGKYTMALSEEAWKKVEDGRSVVDAIVASGKVTYGINTGFGHFAKVTIPDDLLEELQYNLIRSHASGVGEFISYERSKRVMALRINVLAKGNSGISRETLERAIAAFNKGCISCIPEKGTVGASGDLAPLAHLALGLMGEGKMWDPKTKTVGDAATILKENGLEPIRLRAKEGLALINGTQFITALGCEALYRAERIAKQADIVMALTFEALRGTTAAYHPYIHEARKHKGQIEVARRLRSILHNDMYYSDINDNLRDKSKVQDSYTLRCVPQVHGICNDTIEFVRGLLTTEMNSATDNPMIFKRDGEEGFIISGGNFHGEYPAKALDYLAIGVHELANISERRIERLVNESLGGLPAFLVSKERGGLDSGFMIAHCCAASLVSENKVLTHPGSVDSISTSSGQEDHVSMGGFCARKALQVVDNVEHVLAIELLAACQGLYLLAPHTTTEPLTAVYNLVRSVVPPYTKDRFMNPDIEACYKLLYENKVWETVEPFMNKYFEAHKN